MKTCIRSNMFKSRTGATSMARNKGYLTIAKLRSAIKLG